MDECSRRHSSRCVRAAAPAALWLILLLLVQITERPTTQSFDAKRLQSGPQEAAVLRSEFLATSRGRNRGDAIPALLVVFQNLLALSCSALKLPSSSRRSCDELLERVRASFPTNCFDRLSICATLLTALTRLPLWNANQAKPPAALAGASWGNHARRFSFRVDLRRVRASH